MRRIAFSLLVVGICATNLYSDPLAELSEISPVALESGDANADGGLWLRYLGPGNVATISEA